MPRQPIVFKQVPLRRSRRLFFRLFAKLMRPARLEDKFALLGVFLNILLFLLDDFLEL